jgi:hypothetical protein
MPYSSWHVALAAAFFALEFFLSLKGGARSVGYLENNTFWKWRERRAGRRAIRSRTTFVCTA